MGKFHQISTKLPVWSFILNTVPGQVSQRLISVFFFHHLLTKCSSRISGSERMIVEIFS